MLTKLTKDSNMFSKIELSDIKQFVMLTGRNGVGKTSLLRDFYFTVKDVNGEDSVLWLDVQDPITVPIHSKTEIFEHWTSKIELELTKRSLKAVIIEHPEFGLDIYNIKRMWVSLLTLCKDRGVQLFTSTQSLGCIQDFSRVAYENDLEVQLMNLRKYPDSIGIEVDVYDTKKLRNLVSAGAELRQ